MNFHIRAIKEESSTKCEVVIKGFKETTPLFTDLWSIPAYEAQWDRALAALVDGLVNRCILVIDIRPLSISAGIVFWALFKDEGDVFLQQRFSRERSLALVAEPIDFESMIAPRLQGTPEEQARVSEWKLSLADVLRYVDERRRLF